MATVYHNLNAIALDAGGRKGLAPAASEKSIALDQFLGHWTPADARVETNMSVQSPVRAWRGGVEAFGGVAAGREGGKDGESETERGKERGWEGAGVCMRTEAPSRASNWVREASVCYARQAVPL